MSMTEDEARLIANDIEASFYRFQDDIIVFGSQTFPSYRITMDMDKAIPFLAEVKKRCHIKKDDKLVLNTHVFRLSSTLGDMKRELWARFDWSEHKSLWTANFYQTCEKDAIDDLHRMIETPYHLTDLVAEGNRLLDLKNASKRTGKNGHI
jgi:hypothetical protein